MLDHLDVRDMRNWQKGRKKYMNESGKKNKNGYFLVLDLTLRKSIYDDNPWASNESRGAPLPWESFCWRMSLILAKWIIHTLFGHLCTPLPQTFIHLWQFYYNLQVLNDQEPKRNAEWRWSKTLTTCWVELYFLPRTIWLLLY